MPIGAAIASPALEGTALAGTTGGILLWTLFGLLGSVRTVSSGDSGHFTFHLPFVGAAMILGGPTAGAWVAFLATTERRELQSQPWYGVLANHASSPSPRSRAAPRTSWASGLRRLTGDAGWPTFVAMLRAGVVLEVVANGLAIVTIKIRDEHELARCARRSSSTTSAGDADRVRADLDRSCIAFATVGWWAPLVIGLGVVAIWRPAKPSGVDKLTGCRRRPRSWTKVDARWAGCGCGVTPGGTMLMFDLNQFKRVQQQALATRSATRSSEVVACAPTASSPAQEDIRGRLMGDEFAVFLVGARRSEVGGAGPTSSSRRSCGRSRPPRAR